MLPKIDDNVFRYNKVDEILIGEGKLFAQLKGKKIDDVWYVWEMNEDVWYNDEAVIIIVEGTQLGINNLYTNSIDISWNAYELIEEIYSFDYGYDFKLKWTNESEIARLLKNEIIEDIQIEEFHWKGKIIKSIQEPEREGESIDAWILS